MLPAEQRETTWVKENVKENVKRDWSISTEYVCGHCLYKIATARQLGEERHITITFLILLH